MGKKVLTRLTMLLCIFTLAATVTAADSYHTLQGGETLYSLARKYGVSVEALLQANGILDPSSLSVGMRLLIPSEGPQENLRYTVKKGDTYYSIARSHGLTVDELLAMNGFNTSRVLRVGEILTLGNPGSGSLNTENRLENAARPANPVPAASPSSPPPAQAEVVNSVPWWPVSGLKKPLDGKLVGVSIEANPRSYVHAVADGKVVWTGPYRGFGHVVLVDCDGYIYLYGGNEDLFVNVGQPVATGNRIGRLGASGPDGATRKMYFSVFREGLPVSPDEAPRG